jgi:predicted MFS family arabinose efflux permease
LLNSGLSPISYALGLASNFYFFALLNLAGAVLVYFTIERVQPMASMPMSPSPLAAMIAHWRNPKLRSAFGIGFCILFAFIGTFTFVNFVLVRPPLSLGRMDLGFVYFVFLPSIATTLLAGKAVTRFGTRPAIWGALAVAAIGLPLMLSAHLANVVTGMVLVGAGTFFAQAAATGFVGQAASENRGVASGTYLACYFLGGLVGTAVLGQLFDHFGWIACIAGVGASLAVAALLTTRLTLPRGS